MTQQSRTQVDSETEVNSSRPTIATLALGFFSGALLLRLFFLFGFSDNPTFDAPVVDAQGYDAMARDIANGRPVGERLFWQPLFYPLWLSSVYTLSSSSMLVAKLFQTIVGSATCLLTFLLASRLLDRRTAIIAGIVTAFYGPLLFFETQLLATGWAAFWSVCLLTLFVIAEREKALWSFGMLGACGALSVLTRPTFLPFFLVACIALFWVVARETKEPRKQGTRIAALLLGWLLFTLPIALFNHHSSGRFTILPSSGGINLFIGNNPNREETLTARPGAQWQAIVQLPAQKNQLEGAWTQQAYFLERVRDYATTAPGDFLAGLGQKALQLISSRELPRNIDIYELSQWSTLSKLLTWKIANFGFPFGLLLPLAAIGLVANWRKWPAAVVLFPFCYGASIVLVFVTARYRIPLIPVLSIFAASGLVAMGHALRKQQWPVLTGMGAAAFLLILLSSWPGPFAEERQSYTGEMYREAALFKIRMNLHTEARALFLESIAADPASAEAHSGLAQTFYREGRLQEARDAWERAVALNPDWFEAVNNLAWLLATTRREDLRDLDRAAQLARHACELRAYRDAGALDTLAAVQANRGEFPEAIATLEQAIALTDRASQEDLLRELEKRHGQYQRQEPYFE